MQRQAVIAAQDPGLEYVKWAGIDQGAYQSLLNAPHTQGDLKTFLSRPVSSVGFCSYRSPAPYQTEYTGYNDPSCGTTACQTTFICNPPTPSYDQFSRWGESDANYSLLSSSQFMSASQGIAVGLAVAIPLVAAGTGVAVNSVLAAAIASEVGIDVLAATLGTTAPTATALAGAEAAARGRRFRAGNECGQLTRQVAGVDDVDTFDDGGGEGRDHERADGNTASKRQ